MPISSSLSARLGPGPAPAPARWSPYARPSEPRRSGAGSGCAKAFRPSLLLEPATARLLGRARKAESRGSGRGAAFGAAAPTPARRRLGDLKKSDQKKDPKPAGTNPEPIQEPRVEESRGCGGFAFLCVLAGHKEAITGISMPMGSDKLYSGSADGSVRVWDGKSGKVAGLSALDILLKTLYARFTFGVLSALIPALPVVVDFCCLINWGVTLVA